MKAEIISIGDELTSGKILDTNSRWLSLELGDLGIRTLYHTTVGDELDAMIDVFRIAVRRSDLVIATGGLGPTADDLTRQAVAGVASVPLLRDDKLLEAIRSLFRRRGRDMPVSNEVQALIPFGARSVPNPNGTAPGIDMTINRMPEHKAVDRSLLDCCRIFALPGVPAEMREMYHGTIEKELLRFLDEHRGEKRVIKTRVIHSFGEGESRVEALLGDMIDRKHTPRVGITADSAVISLRIVAEARTEAECDTQIEGVARRIYERLGTLIFGEGDDRLQDVLCRRLGELGKTLAVAEIGTRGHLAEAVSSSKAAAAVFRGGVVETTGHYGQAEILDRLGDIENLFDADYLLAVGPYRDEVELAIFARGRKTLLRTKSSTAGHPAIIDNMITLRAMNLLRLHLLSENAATS